MSLSKRRDNFIKKAKEKHGDKYDYSLVKYVDVHTKVTIICPKCGEFEQSPKQHCKSNCPLCVPNRKLNKNTLIEKFKEKHGDKYDYSKMEYVNVNTKVTIICPNCGEFEQRPSSHYKYGCNKCSKNETKYDTESFIEKCKEVHGNKYDYSKVNFKTTKEKITIICPQHGEFEQVAFSHIHGHNCLQCSNIKQSKTNSSTTDKFIENAKKIHRDTYNYSKVKYINRKTNIIIICPKHGEFQQRPSNHLLSRGCNKCMYCPSCSLFRTGGVKCKYCKPKKENKLYQKTKEFKAVEYLRNNIDKEFIHNESIGSVCTKNDRQNTNGHIYPDIRFDCNWYQLIIEIDEHQHRGAGYKCDKRRMYDIIAKLGMPCVFIRYNPDNKESDLKELENKINNYLKYEDELGSKELKVNKYGYKCEYLFYK